MKKGGSDDLPSNIREWNIFSRMTDEQKQQYLSMKRAQQFTDLGGSVIAQNPLDVTSPLAQYGKTPLPGDMPAFRAAQSAAVQGVEGSAGQQAVDREFAKEYAAYKAAGGYADVQKQLVQLQEASAALGKKGAKLSGGLTGITPEVIQSFTNPEALSTKEKVQEVAQRNLRQVLGAQFTEKEGEKLVARAYNPKLQEDENKKRVDRLITQIDLAAQAKQSASDYFEQNGTLAGWQGKIPTIADFEAAIDGKPVAETAPKTPAEVLMDDNAALDIVKGNAKNPPPIGNVGVPNGIPPNVWAAMTPEEKALFQ
jgi:hypothetical protein